MNAVYQLNQSTYRLGFSSALLVVVEVAVFAVTLLIPSALTLSFIASFLLAPSFVALVLSIHYYAQPEKRIWSHLGLAFAVMYAVMVTINYFVQLAVVSGNPLRASADVLALFTFTPGSVMFVVDMLGYSFMCLATLAAAPVFAGGRLERWLRGLFVVHGLLFAPTLIMTVIFPALSSGQPASPSVDIGALVLLGWCAIFLPLPVLLAVLFRKLERQAARA
jgi:hypothetical protein